MSLKHIKERLAFETVAMKIRVSTIRIMDSMDMKEASLYREKAELTWRRRRKLQELVYHHDCMGWLRSKIFGTVNTDTVRLAGEGLHHHRDEAKAIEDWLEGNKVS
jgi:hypothetical protein